jgi:sigma-B regulation protein RsbU (phosphoserine phosphatase)
MFTRSLRGKVFLLVFAILLGVAAVVMPITQRDVTQTVVAREEHAVDNTLNLVLGDTDARWSALLDDKINVVRQDRNDLIELGSMMNSVLSRYAALADTGRLSTPAAQQQALAWIGDLKFNSLRYAFVYDAHNKVLAGGAPGLAGFDLSDIRDIKGQPLARSMFDESRMSGHGFALFRWPVPGSQGAMETRYAYFGYFQPWNWVFAISDDARTLLTLTQTQRQNMEAAVRASLARLTLAKSGFVFITDNNGRLVAPPPADRADLLHAIDKSTGKPLSAMLTQAQHAAGRLQFRLEAAGQAWEIEAVYHKPLGWTLVAAVPRSDLTEPAYRLVNRLALFFAGLLALALAGAWLMAARITRPLDLLTDYARELPEQDLTAPAETPARIAALPRQYRDEVGRLAASFLFMQDKLGENVARLMSETSSRQRIESELNIAHDIQLGLLPVPLAGEIRLRVDLHAVMRPAKEVGGDLYDYFELPDGRLCWTIGDVSGKGVPAALFMAITRTLIRATAEDETDPAVIVHRVNNRLSANNPNMMFVTLLLGVLDLATGALSWANAGHPPPAVIGADGTVRLLEGRSGPACGVQEDLPYRRLDARLEPGETLVGYTDGITDAMDARNEQYGEKRMLHRLAAAPGEAADLAGRLVADVDAHAGEAEQFDDITLVVIRRL